MKPGRRNGCLIAILILAAFACCIAAAAAVALGLVTDWTYDINWRRPGEFFRSIDWERAWAGGHLSDTEERTFEDVGDQPRLVIVDFTGQVTILAGEADTIEVVATKRANSQNRLDSIDIQWSQDELGVEITARRGRTSGGRVSVDLDITAPPGTELELRLAAGDVRVEDIIGEIVVHTGTGDLDIRGGGGPVNLRTGTGDIYVEDVDGELVASTGTGRVDVEGCDGRVDLHSGTGDIVYQGRPEGNSLFGSGVGDITLKLPSDADVEIELASGLGDVNVRDFEGVEESRHVATGVIGDGSRGSVRARTGSGSIDLYER